MGGVERIPELQVNQGTTGKKSVNCWSKEITKLDRQTAQDVIGLMTGHCNLRCYTHEIQRHSNLRRWCNEKEDTP